MPEQKPIPKLIVHDSVYVDVLVADEIASLENVDALSQEQLERLEVRLKGLRGQVQTIEDIIERATN